MLVQGGGGIPPLIKEGRAPRPEKIGLVDGNSNNLVPDADYNYRDLEPRRNGTLRVTFSDIQIINSAKEGLEEKEAGEEESRRAVESRIPDMVDSYPEGHLPIGDVAYRSKQIRSEYEGWDNPFRAEGEVSQDADIIIQLWRENRLKGDLATLLRSKGGLDDLLKEAENQSKAANSGNAGTDKVDNPSSRNGITHPKSTEKLEKSTNFPRHENAGKAESVHGGVDRQKKSEKKNKFEIQCCSLM